ncbi:hypothetical protein D3C77_469990 [compost metagenome]
MVDFAARINQQPVFTADVGVEGLSLNVIVDVDERIEPLVCLRIDDRIQFFIIEIGARCPIGDEIGQILGVGIVLGHVAVEPVRCGLEHILIVGCAAAPITAIHAIDDSLQLGQGVGVFQIHADRLIGLGIKVHQEQIDLARPLGTRAGLEGSKHLSQL